MIDTAILLVDPERLVAAMQWHQDANFPGPEHRFHCGGTCAYDIGRRYEQLTYSDGDERWVRP